jgi:hypothetical protein
MRLQRQALRIWVMRGAYQNAPPIYLHIGGAYQNAPPIWYRRCILYVPRIYIQMRLLCSAFEFGTKKH